MTLTAQEQSQVERRVQNSGLSTSLAFCLWLFLGLFGAHRFYCKQAKLGLITIALYIVASLALFVPVHTQMPDYTQCTHNSVRNSIPIAESACQPNVDSLSSIGSISLLLGAGLFLALLLWWLIDIFFITKNIQKVNSKLRQEFQKEVLKQRNSTVA